MRIAYVVSGILGGAGRVVHELASALPASVHSTSILFSTAPPDAAMVSMLRASCDQVLAVTKLAKVDPIAVARLSALLHRTNPDVVLLHD